MRGVREDCFHTLALSLFIAGARPENLCSGLSSSCSSWAADGHCDGANAYVVRTTCPASCRVCEPGCSDASDACGSWQRQGECEANPDHMLSACPESCGLCKSTKCADKLSTLCDPSSCNSEIMLRLCPKTCGVCASACLDLHQDCSGWARESACFENPGFALANCPRSCGVCSDGCEDYNRTQCQIWGRDECNRNPGAMLRDCPETCGVCVTACTDKAAACRQWAQEGECEKNPIAMARDCSNACGLCHILSDMKDEL